DTHCSYTYVTSQFPFLDHQRHVSRFTCNCRELLLFAVCCGSLPHWLVIRSLMGISSHKSLEPLYCTAQSIYALLRSPKIGEVHQMAHIGITHQFNRVFAFAQHNKQLQGLTPWAAQVVRCM